MTPEQQDAKLTEGMAGRLAKAFVQSKLTPLLIVSAVAVGVFSTWMLPREEEPQIQVPMVDVFVQLPGATPREVEERVTNPLERMLYEIPGVEYIYSTSQAGGSMVIVRFEVGADVERAIVRVRDKIAAYPDRLSAGASPPLIRPRSIDDVPVLSLTLSSDEADSFALGRIAEELRGEIKQVTNVSEVSIIGGEARRLRVLVDPEALAARGLPPLAVVQALHMQNQRIPSGSFAQDNRELLVETGTVLTNAEEVRSVVVGVADGRPVYLRDVAEVRDGGAEPSNYVRMGTGAASGAIGGAQPAVTLAVAKRAGTNAVELVHAVLAKVDSIEASIVPAGVDLHVTRDYGESASEKSNELLLHMGIAVVGVAILILLALGRREAVIVMLAIPATLALTLTVFYLYGYTLNRITLFALIFSIGILVDDAIVVVENIARHFHLPENKDRTIVDIAIRATGEVGNPTILATGTVIGAILPMAFVGGMMGPYMRPIPVGATAAMIFSLIIAFAVTPWASAKLLKRDGGGHGEGEEGASTKAYRKIMGALIAKPKVRGVFLVGIVVLLLGSVALFPIGFVEVKMLPFDNKSEFQVVIDMPEGTPLEQTARVTQAIADVVAEQPEVLHYQSYIGTSGPITFSGLVRHYFLRRGSNMADIVVGLTPKHDRDAQSHDIAQRVRNEIAPVVERFGARVAVTEVPPGPPVMQTLVAEVYGPDYEGQVELARQLRESMEQTPGIVDVDWMVEDPQPQLRILVDEEKAAAVGIAEAEVARTLRLALAGEAAGLLHDEREATDVPIMVQLERADRSDIERLQGIHLVGAAGAPVPLRELVRVEESAVAHAIYHKNLQPVVYVMADVAGEIESPVYAMLELGPALDSIAEGLGLENFDQHTAAQPAFNHTYSVKWDGEWHITYEVFRDLGIAFGAVLILIYVLVVAWFRSYTVPIVIMSAIPFSLVGILPAHGMMGAFFTATSMIGFIAGAGIVVRNSIILVDFIELRLSEGMPLEEAVVDAGAVRFRPMVLTAAAVIVGAAVILADPIFQGLAISLMAGEVASLLLSRMTVPVTYYMLRRHEAKKAGKVEEREETEEPKLPFLAAEE